MAAFEEQLAKQTQLMNSISRVVTNVKKLGQARMTVAVISSRMERLQAQFNEVRDLDAKLHAGAAEMQKMHAYFTEQQFVLCEQIFDESIDYMTDVIAKLTPSTSNDPAAGAASTAAVFSNPISSLPRIELPVFDGSFRHWETFRDRFTSMIIQNPSLSNVERMHYLCSVLSGDASHALSHLTVTADNFDVAWQIISSRYENKRRLINSHLETLCMLPLATSETSRDLQTLRDSTNTAIQALRNLGRPVDSWEDVLVFLVSKKLDRASRKAWELKLSENTNVPPYAELDKFLQSRIRALDAITPAASSRTPECSSKSQRAKGVVIHSTVSIPVTCSVCRSPHPLYKCSQFLSYTPARRYDLIKNQRRCFNCFAVSHSSKECRSQYRCRECKQKHHTLIHSADRVKSSCERSVPIAQRNEPDASEEGPSLTTASTVTYKQSVLLATARVRVLRSQGHSITLRALLDQGSAASLISERAASMLSLPRTRQSVTIAGIGEIQSAAKSSVQIRFTSVYTDPPTFSTVAFVLHPLTKYAPSRRSSAVPCSLFSDLMLADHDPMSSDPIDLILGADIYGQLIRDGIRKGALDEPIAQNTALGWILYGPTSQAGAVSSVVSHHGSVLDDLDLSLRRFWELEDLPQSKLLTSLEQQCEDHFLSTHSRSPDGRYLVRLPFRIDPPILGDSKKAAINSLERMERHLHRIPAKSRAYSDFLADYHSLGHMVKAPPLDSSAPHYYIPHHAVMRDQEDPMRLRVVFNASSRTSSGFSLNDCLHVGPKLQTDIGAILLRWRQFQYVLSADVEKMYRQIRVSSLDADYQRIVWRYPPDGSLEEYQLRTVTYGTACAPFFALRVVQQLAHDEGKLFPLACAVLKNQTYVDDCIFGADDPATALRIRDQLIALLNKGGFQLRKWASNCAQLLTSIDPSDRVVGRCGVLEDTSLRILGICWLPDRDLFKYKVDASPSAVSSKREILSIISKIFDPLGWVTPVIITAKILLQSLWTLKVGWDQELPPDILSHWHQFQEQLIFLEALEIPRWTRYLTTMTRPELHGFADASQKAYAAAVYLRLVLSNGQVEVSLLAAKSKVAPIKPMSIPRLELCAALLLARLLDYVRSALSLAASECMCWTDSTVTLAWVSQHPSRWKQFVANRVAKIQELLPSVRWGHVSTHDNPADCASRGISPRALVMNSLWWSGPEWLLSAAECWPSTSLEVPTDLLPENRVVHHGCREPSFQRWNLSVRYSSWFKLLRITAYILRFVQRLKRAPTHPTSQPSPIPSNMPSAGEIRRARLYWYRYIQTDLFPEEQASLLRSSPVKKSSALASLHPYLDADGLIRVQGRLNQAKLPLDAKHPIIIKSHPLLDLIINETHLQSLHAGPRLTLALLRRDLWILRARATVRSVLHRCVACTRERASVPEQLMGDLPDFRVNPAVRAFVHVGVDYAGPLLVRNAPGRGYKAHKAYIVLFICMTTKAIHLELVSDYSTAAFLAAYQRFAARRGIPSDIYSDNGTTFQGADRELSEAHQVSLSSASFSNHLAHDGTSWHFIPPAAPHFGGLWEAAIKSVKHHLRRTIGSHTLTFEEMSTLLCRIESWLNSRPLGPVTDALDDYSALTPGHFLTGTSLVAVPEPSLLDLAEHRLSRWQLVQAISERVWKAWSTDYVHSLQQRPKWRTIQRLTKPGQMVLVRDPAAPPSRWKLGRIEECHPGPDGLVRVVSVKTRDSKYTRPITKLCFLPIDINRDIENPAVTAGGDSGSCDSVAK